MSKNTDDKANKEALEREVERLRRESDTIFENLGNQISSHAFECVEMDRRKAEKDLREFLQNQTKCTGETDTPHSADGIDHQ